MNYSLKPVVSTYETHYNVIYEFIIYVLLHTTEIFEVKQNNLLYTSSSHNFFGVFNMDIVSQKADFDQLVHQKRDPANYVIHIMAGKATIKIDDKKHLIETGNLILIPKGNSIDFLSTDDLKATVIFFNDQFLQNNEDEFFIFLLFNLFKPNHYIHELEVKDAARLEVLLTVMSMEYNFAGKNNKEIINHLFKAVLLKIETFVEASNPLSLEYNDSDHYLFLRFRKLLEQNYKSSYSVESYAKELNVSTKKLLEVSRRVSGMTPSELIKNRIIEEAKNLLKKNKYSIKEIAGILGFEYAANFSQYFKKITSLSPKNYRNSISISNK